MKISNQKDVATHCTVNVNVTTIMEKQRPGLLTVFIQQLSAHDC